MKRIYLFVLLVFTVARLSAQNDTLLWENFESETIDYIVIDVPTGAPNLSPIWLNFDVDGVDDGSGSDRPGEWFLTYGFADVDSSNTVMASNSWLAGFADGAENWLMTPQIHIEDDQATLFWKSAPYQLPRYMDGYKILVSTATNVESDFLDTLAVFAQFDGHNTTDVEDTATYVFTDGIMHTELDYDSADVTRHRGVLQQWQASLAAYEGQDIFIAFVHGSDDDNLISIDDILVLGTSHVGIEERQTFSGMRLYPNPVDGDGRIFVEYNISNLSTVSYRILDLLGNLVLEQSGHVQLAGTHTLSLNVDFLSAGSYILQLQSVTGTRSDRFVILN